MREQTGSAPITARDFFLGVRAAAVGGEVPEVLRPYATAGSDEQGEYSDPYGGFFVPRSIAAPVRVPVPDVLAQYCRPVQMEAPTVDVPARVDEDHSDSVAGGLVVYHGAETIDATASRVESRMITLDARFEYALGYVSERLLLASPTAYMALLQGAAEDAMNGEMLRQRIRGTGVGEGLGVLNASCLIVVDGELGQGSNTIIAENIDKMVARAWGYDSPYAAWAANPDTRAQLLGLSRVVGDAGSALPYFEPAQRTGEPDRLLGRPIYFLEQASTLGDVGDIIYGCWSEYLDGRYAPLTYIDSVHVRFLADERAFKFYQRRDGAPWWRVALTPQNGANTLSPFVTLGAR